MNAFFKSLFKKTDSAELPFSYAIRRSLRAAKVRIVVKPGKVEVVAPLKALEANIHQFVLSQRQWVIQALAKMAAAAQIANLAPQRYHDGVQVPYQGGYFRLTLKPSKLKRIKIEFNAGFIALMPDTLPAREQSELLRTALINWFKKQARIQVDLQITKHAGKHNLHPRSISIKQQKSRWGSCGAHNDIAINWLLLLAPSEILEYVVVHELCHILEKNHSPRFWALVADHLPNYRQHRRWLKTHGDQLMKGL